jgi:BirA family biotin operon repressor/biotin-[acetyl-CoA-carboxylase] ligase
MAFRQTAGRGTRGRQWHDGAGNLMLSVLLRPATKAADAGQWSLLAGLAAIEALTPYSQARLQLKWPNDLMQDGAKLAGILVETEAAPDGGLAWLVIGIGANLAHAPVLADRQTAALAVPVAPTIVAAAILERLELWRGRFAKEGFGPVRDAWISRSYPIGAPVAVTLPTGTCRGTFAGLAANGALLLATGAAVTAITTGEIALVG